ncbi:hypothetical protein SCLCIDRAFT_1115888 [Scleroderma citrinum Foug A]|uniref:Uncharacterized protein n=1 Tax=Scleroderma citrinum Foug A TaxID=1036808 RepID=A0A0C3DP21_9AGAM|nr:hypothetical protein SCLCIDRAFT_1115888 [Scleroderma citrinum Foug A]
MMYDDIMTLLSRWNSHKAGHLPQVQERVSLTDGGTMHFGHTLSADIGEMPRICVPFSHRMVVLSESRMCRPPLGLPTGSDQSALSCRCCTPHNEFLCGRPAKRRCPIQAICIGFSYVLVAKSIKRCGAGDTQLGKQCYMPPFLGNNGASCLLGANQSGTPCIYSGPCGFSKHNTGWYTGVSASYVTIIPWSLIPWNYPGALWRKLEHDGFLTPWIWACPGKDTLLFGKGPYSPSRINRMVTTANANLRWRSLPLARITDLRGLSFASHTPTNIPVWRQLHI